MNTLAGLLFESMGRRVATIRAQHLAFEPFSSPAGSGVQAAEIALPAF